MVWPKLGAGEWFMLSVKSCVPCVPPSSPLFFPSRSPAACLRFSFSLLLSRFDGILVAAACGGEARMCTFMGPVFPVGTFT